MITTIGEKKLVLLPHQTWGTPDFEQELRKFKEQNPDKKITSVSIGLFQMQIKCE